MGNSHDLHDTGLRGAVGAGHGPDCSGCETAAVRAEFAQHLRDLTRIEFLRLDGRLSRWRPERDPAPADSDCEVELVWLQRGPRPATAWIGFSRTRSVRLRSVRAVAGSLGIVLEGRAACACVPVPDVIVETWAVENAIALEGLERAWGRSHCGAAPHPCMAGPDGVLYLLVRSYLRPRWEGTWTALR